MKIKGTIVLESSGNQLSVNDQVCTGDNIIFKSSDAVAIVHSSSKGRYTIKPGKNRSNELEGIIKESVASALSKSKANLETRAEVNLKNEFGDAYCVIGKSLVGIDQEDYPVDAAKYFVVRFTYQGKEYENILTFTDGAIILDKNAVYAIDGNPVDQYAVNEVWLFYRDEKAKQLKHIAKFRLRFLETSDLKPEAENFIKNMKSAGKDAGEIKSEFYLYICDVYGLSLIHI